MSARILYHERREFDGGQHTHESNQCVRVELRQWKDGAHHDTILDSLVVVDGDEILNSQKVLRGTTDAGAIRHAIEQFDSYVSAHPWANGTPDEVAQ